MKGFYQSSRPIGWRNRKHVCNHPVYSACTLYKKGEFGLAVVQQRFNETEKVFWWGAVDPWLAEDIFASENFEEVFGKYAGVKENDLYPTIAVRKLMYALGMKPMKKEYWEKFPEQS